VTPREILFEAMLAGAADLKRRAALLDRINVFPVVDADTGANLSRTIDALAVAIDTGAKDAGRALLAGARGNSGIILAEHLVGAFESLDSAACLDAPSFADALDRGKELAYRAVARPVEGTMLTVMTALPSIVRDLGFVTDLDAHKELERRLAAIVADTPRLMPRLAEAGVVDSGALGFHVFACGAALFLPALADRDAGLAAIRRRRDGVEEAPLGAIADRIEPRFLADAARAQEVDTRWCVDAVVELNGEPADGLTARLSAIGGSVDVARAGSLLKLHVHCDAPDDVRRAISGLGRVVSFNTDDMAAGLIRAGAPATAVPARALDQRLRAAGDSSMSLSTELAAEWGVARLENYVGAGGVMMRDAALDRDVLFSRMREGQVFTTAQASPAEARAFVDALLASPGRAVYLAVGRAYTGTQELVRAAAAGHPERDRLTILDTRAASGQQGLATLLTARRARTAAGFEALVAYASLQIAACREYLAIESLEFLSRTGRVGKIKAALAGALSMRPIVGHGGDGAITYAKVRSEDAAIREVVRRVAAHPGEGRLVVMLEYTDNRKRVEEIGAILAAALPPDTEILFSPLSSTASVHMGPGTWGAAVTRE
jgi:DegV family protein with EDD domain